MGRSSACPDDLDRFAARSRRADDVLRAHESRLRGDYDRLDRRTTIVDPVGGTSRLHYTPGGRVRTVAEPSGRETTIEHDRCGHAVGRVDAAGRRWAFRDDADGALIESIGPGGEAERVAYD